jgi:hypothetical protein
MLRALEDEMEAWSVASEAIMLRAASNKTIMLVEGAKDNKFFNRFVDKDVCDIVISYGHENAVGALAILKDRNLDGIVCVIDSDFSGFGPVVEDPNIIRTDLHDLETMLIESPAFDRVLAELGSEAKIVNLINRGKNPREIVRAAAHPLGVLRHHSLVASLNLDFDGFGLSHVDRRTLEVDIDEMIAHSLRRSRKPPNHHQDARRYIAVWIGRRHNHWHMCCGHDLAEVFGLALQSVLGTQNATLVKADQIERALRLAYEWADFVKTALHAKIREWELRNAPYRCLKI